MRGITKERLREFLRKDINNQNDRGINVLSWLIDYQCTELNPWQTIESAPKDKPVLLYGGHVPCCQMFVGHANANWSWEPTHWQELPKDPK